MKTIEVEFTIGDRVRVKETGEEFVVKTISVNKNLSVEYLLEDGSWYLTNELELVKPVIEWRRNTDYWLGGRWEVGDDGRVFYARAFVRTCPTPEEGKALAEATEKLWKGEK